MNLLIVDNEPEAAERLITLLKKSREPFILQGVFKSIKETVAFFLSGHKTDLIFLDIELSDGISFDIFNQIAVDAPIIFTTAYEKYALQAFKYFSIDYLLKPFELEDLERAFGKWKRLSDQSIKLHEQIGQLKEELRMENHKPKSRLLVKTGNKLQYKPSEKVAYFLANGKEVYIFTLGENKKFLINYTLEELEGQLNKDKFFRISRNAIVNVDAIAEVKGLISTRLEIKLNQPCIHELAISRDRSSHFKIWLDR